MRIISEFSNELLKRKEIVAEIGSEKNPGFEKARKEIAAHFNANEDMVVIKTLRGRFGSNSFLIDAFIYSSLQNKEKIEPKRKIKKEAKAAVQPAAK